VISIIINSRDDARFAAVEAMYRQLLVGEPSEIIRIPDARSMSEGYNRGINASQGEILVFSHDDVQILQPKFVERVKEHLRSYDLIGVAGTIKLVHPSWAFAGPPYVYGQIAQPSTKTTAWDAMIWCNARRSIGNICAMDGVMFACQRPMLDKVSFDNAYDGFHLYDIDFSYAAYRAGLRLGVCCDFNILHGSVGRGEEPEWRRLAGIFMHKWGGTFPLAQSVHPWYPACVRCSRNEEIVEVFTPAHWDSPERTV
jgi:hypothetical protein